MRDSFEQFDFVADGISFRCEISSDSHNAPPWVEYDGHGVIRTVSSYYGNPDKKPGEVILYSDRGDYWLYDVQATTEKAKREVWGCRGEAAGLTPGQRAAQAVREDFEYCRKWLQGDIFWTVLEVYPIDEEGEKIGEDSDYLGGVEYGYTKELGEYVKQTAKEMGEGMAYPMNKEKSEADYWASRDVVTV